MLPFFFWVGVMKAAHRYILTLTCPDRVGIVAQVSELIASVKGWVTEANYHSDQDSGLFFMRNEIRGDSISDQVDAFKTRFSDIAAEFNMQWALHDTAEKQRVVLFASKASHCLNDLLHRWHSGELDCTISAVISNHESLRRMVDWYDIPFECIPILPEAKATGFDQVAQALTRLQPDAVVLARYMQVLPTSICETFSGRMINIHHSFLPSFMGANPYQRAFERGVKLIGATSHYVTEDLDEGPIIEQDVSRVSHRHETKDLIRLGKDIERVVLARAVRQHLEHRVFISGNKTVIFD
jgi:formyltetrahydrofolate deformylase